MSKAVFGTGIALINNWSIIKDKFAPQFAIDNNFAKCGKIDDITGLKCISFDQIENVEELEVLITVGDPYAIESISKQLVEREVKYYILTDMLDEWCKDIRLPKHLESMSVEDDKIILFNTPAHDNIGDHLIALAELEFLEKKFLNHKIYEVTDIEYIQHHLKLKNRIKKDDIILISGGGYAGSLWLYNGEHNIRNILIEYPNNYIVVLPQTVFFESNSRGDIEFDNSVRIYNSHNNVIFCAREKKSFDIFSDILGSTDRVFLLPDMAMLYKNVPIVQKKRSLVLVCFRKDKERIMESAHYNHLLKEVEDMGYEIKYTTMHSERIIGIENRTEQVANKLKEIGAAELVITDTLHCMISSAIMGTTCLAFDNLTGKVKNVYAWLKDLQYIKFEQNVIENNLNVINRYDINELDQYEQQLVRIIRGEFLT